MTITHPAEKLTNREREILRLLAEGETSACIADRLFISKRTVDFHASNIHVKLGVRNRIQAINRARERGLL